MSNIITHPARVIEVKQSSVVVRVERNDACSSCHAEKKCVPDGAIAHDIEIFGDFSGLKAGATVTISISASVGFFAILFSYIIPTMLLITTLLSFKKQTESEVFVAFLALGVITLYYLILKFLHPYFEKKINFQLLNHPS